MEINGLGVARCLGRAGVWVVGVAAAPLPHTTRTRCARRITTCEDINGPGLIKLLLKLAEGAETRRALFVTSDLHVRTVAAHRETLKPHYAITLPPTDVVNALLNKPDFLEVAKREGFAAPAWAAAASDNELGGAAEQTGFPCIVRPAAKALGFLGTFHQKAFLCKGPRDLETIAAADYNYDVPLFVQQWVPGGDDDVCFVLHYFNAESEPLVSFCGKKIRQAPPGTGHTVSAQPADIPEAVTLSERFFRAVNFVGLCSMEFKRDARDGRFLMIEPTVGRTDWQSAVASINGVPIPYIAYRDIAGLPPISYTRRHPLTWVEFEGDIRSALYYRRRGQLSLASWLRSIWPWRPAVASLSDPLPGLLFGWELCVRAVKKGLRLLGLAKRKP